MFAIIETHDGLHLEFLGCERRRSSSLHRSYCAVLDIVGTSTALDSLAMARRGGEVCLVGFLGGAEPFACQPVFQIPSGVRLSVFASALAFGTLEFPLEEIPFQQIVDAVARGKFVARPARVFPFEQIQEAHRLVESAEAGGKVVVTLDGLYSRP